jgi:hypothetical protein
VGPRDGGPVSAEVKRIIHSSSEDFYALAWPVLAPGLGTECIPVETAAGSEFAEALDTRTGIDMLIVGHDRITRGLASRIQWWYPPHPANLTMRVRSRGGQRTEYHKRRAEQAAAGAVTPYYACHGFVDKPDAGVHRNGSRPPGPEVPGKRLIGCAVVLMADFAAAVSNRVGSALPPNPDGSRGWTVPWDHFIRNGLWIMRWAPETGLLGGQE